MLKKKRVKILLENLSNYKNYRPFHYIFTTPEEYKYVLDRVADEHVHLFFDVGHGAICEGDPALVLKEFHHRIWGMSFSNNDGVRDLHLGIHQGVVDYQKIIDTIVKVAWKGVIAFKIRLGHKEDILRVKTVREAMGEDFILMLDSNQRYKAEDAIQITKDLSAYNMLWIEEPTENNLEEIAKIKKSSVLPIALGENIIDESDFITICQNKLTDILQPDLPRCGGITGFLRVLEIALKYKIPVCNHLLYELSLSVVAAYENGYMIEYDNLLPLNLFTHDFNVVDGCMKPPASFGTGVELTDAALTKYALSFHTIRASSLI